MSSVCVAQVTGVAGNDQIQEVPVDKITLFVAMSCVFSISSDTIISVRCDRLILAER